MKNRNSSTILFLGILILPCLSCKKEMIQEKDTSKILKSIPAASLRVGNESLYNLEVVLQGEKNMNGHIHFRQDPDPANIISLDVMVHNLKPNHEYQLWRAVDTNLLDGSCTGVNWLALGYGLTPKTILTNNKGDGKEELWRDLLLISGTFDIHFQVRDMANVVVLSSGCYQYTVR